MLVMQVYNMTVPPPPPPVPPAPGTSSGPATGAIVGIVVGVVVAVTLFLILACAGLNATSTPSFRLSLNPHCEPNTCHVC